MTETVRLSAYQPYSHRLHRVELTFRLHPTRTRVVSRLTFSQDPARAEKSDLRLDGEKLHLLRASIDGRAFEARPDATGLTVPAALLPDGEFVLETEV
jgi:aminopeptidase N